MSVNLGSASIKAIGYRLGRPAGVSMNKAAVRGTGASRLGYALGKRAAEAARGVRDGTGPHTDSYRRRKEKKRKGRRQEAGEPCPAKQKQE